MSVGDADKGKGMAKLGFGDLWVHALIGGVIESKEAL